jgi:sugar phosphate isomerase/epimerase
MNRKRHSVLSLWPALLALLTFVVPCVRGAGFVPLFDGRSLRGWRAVGEVRWLVRDGLLTASPQAVGTNSGYLVWQGGQLGDFDVKLRFRIGEGPQAGSALIIRGTERANGTVEGYRVILGGTLKPSLSLQDQILPRGTLAERGQRVTFDERGNRTVVRFADGVVLGRQLRPEGWNECHLVARGSTLSLRVNGFEMWELLDLDPIRGSDRPGLIALQVSPGSAAAIQYKEIFLRDDASKTAPPLFAFCMDASEAGRGSLAQQAELLRDLGYEGAGHIGLDRVQERLKTLDAAGLKLRQISVRLEVSPDCLQPFDPHLKEVLPLLKGHDTMLAVVIAGGKTSDESVDERAVELLRELAALAKPLEVQIALCPQTGEWLERVEDAIRVARKTDRDNVGILFDLGHWLRTARQAEYEPVLEQAMPWLLALSINGADRLAGQPGWSSPVRPLDSGAFELRPFLETLTRLGFTGPIGLQCQGAAGDASDHLRRSIVAWRKFYQPPAAE